MKKRKEKREKRGEEGGEIQQGTRERKHHIRSQKRVDRNHPVG